ncbi:hypothetical protein AGMMS4956_11940 [Bacteroidia bacterium]|nr:hypothetical protein AGMMS4956_11940 [Bacteroidia bacterium]
MEKNPILLSYKTELLYISIWVVLTLAQIIITSHYFSLSAEYLIVDKIIFNTCFAVFLLPVWYPVRYNRWERKAWWVHVFAHLCIFAVYIIASLLVGYTLMWFYAGSHSDYMFHLHHSVWHRFIAGMLFYLITVLVYYLYIYIKQLNIKVANEIRLNQLIKDHELNLLKSQINPHFLFNSLNSLNALIIQNPEQSQKMLVALSEYLRYAVLANNNAYSTLQSELHNVKRYLAIEQLRFGNKLTYTFDIDPATDAVKIPSMLLQPLFENAVKHGVYESLQQVSIHVATACSSDRYVTLTIDNEYDANNIAPKKGSGTGLANIRARLQLSYGDKASLQTKIENGKFVATLKIPIKHSSKN